MRATRALSTSICVWMAMLLVGVPVLLFTIARGLPAVLARRLPQKEDVV